MTKDSATVYELDTYAIHYIALCLWVRGALRDFARNGEEARSHQMTVQQFSIDATLGMFVQMIAGIIRQGVNEDDWYDILEVVHNALDEEMNLGSETSGSQDLNEFLNSLRTGSVRGSRGGGGGGPDDGEVH
jgi:hypothetical protein